MQILVNDDSIIAPSALKGKPEWHRWKPTGRLEGRGDTGTFAIGRRLRGIPEGWSDYRHVVPDPEQWAALEANQAGPPRVPGRP